MKYQLTSGVIPAMHGPCPDEGVVIARAATNQMYVRRGGFGLYVQHGVRHPLYFAAPLDIPQMSALLVRDYHIIDGELTPLQPVEVYHA